ncbi:DUF928 domain-containing protein [Geitlerinema sp. PCC 9228]|jgi:hypothetical protein|uniref:DUF928 domain-containing protein n=1 Tax=Geitlerinema sp. PCC 9228 TaxID=111611 RepID=UPI0008F99203|nr:DUF928 domain-containing protein [Geitlerinema sp. PCC 9228]
MTTRNRFGRQNAHPYQHLRRFGLAALLVFSFWGMPAAALEFTPPSQAPSGRLQQPNPRSFEPQNEGKPGRLEGAGTRGGCPTAGQFTLLLPPDYFGLTLQASPSFYMYVPTRCQVPVEFALLDEQQQEILYRTTIETTGVPGVVRVDLSDAQAPALAPGKTYYWEASLILSGDISDRSQDVYDFGWIRRVKPTDAFQQQLETTSGMDRVTLYAETGLWYDALDLLAKLRLQSESNGGRTYGEMTSNKYAQQWQELLRSVNLDRVAKSPLTFSLPSQEETDDLEFHR